MHVPRGTISWTLFSRRFLPNNYAYNSGVSLLMRLGAQASDRMDFFGESVSSFRQKITKFVFTSYDDFVAMRFLN